jgi:predicted lipoprotein with Yx(FWY)xxD motif
MRMIYIAIATCMLGLALTWSRVACADEPELVVWTTPAKVDFWVPSGIAVQNNPVTGQVFVDSHGMPLYVFDCDRDLNSLNEKDYAGNSRRDTCVRVIARIKQPVDTAPTKCVETCVGEHPPVLSADGETGRGDWSLVKREGSAFQWAYKGRPLYGYKYDDTPGYPYGADIGGVWSQATVAGPTFAPYRVASKTNPPAAPAAPFPLAPGVTVQRTTSGVFLSDYRGMTLYRVDKEPISTAGKTVRAPNTMRWEPLRAGSIAVPVKDWTVVTSDGGVLQWAFKGRALYTCTGDARPGDQNCASESSRPVKIEQATLTAKELR